MIDRSDIIKEIRLREAIRSNIAAAERRKRKQLAKSIFLEAKLRRTLRKVIIEGGAKISDKVPHSSTGINVLEDMLKKIIPILESGYKLLTSSEIQRNSYRAHILNAIMKSIAPPRTLRAAEVGALLGDKSKEALPDAEGIPTETPPDQFDAEVSELAENINSFLSDLLLEQVPGDDGVELQMNGPAPEEDEAFIPIDGGEQDPRDEFGGELDNVDQVDNSGDWKTGRNVAYDVYSRIERNIIDAYELLTSDEDRQLFYNYLLTNVKLYFDKFENELGVEIIEPTTQAYEDSVAQDQQYLSGGM